MDIPRPVNWPAHLRDPNPPDYPEDASDSDNGCYWHVCHHCGVSFIGHKRRVPQCKVCTNQAKAEQDERRAWLRANGKDPSEWVLLTKQEHQDLILAYSQLLMECANKGKTP